jgi:hypothetical protein
MRVALVLVVAACTPEIESGAYLCGPEQLCPVGLACSGSDFTCEAPEDVQPFTCNAPATSATSPQRVPPLTCVSGTTLTSCLTAGSTGAWFQLATPASCTTVGVTAEIDFPFAFESLDLVLADATGAPIGSDGACVTPADGLDSRCLAMTLADSTTYLLEVVPAGSDCDGDCDYNQYALSFHLDAP